MGFLKFLKRDKSKDPDFGLEDTEGLDMPPPPPELGEQGAGGKEFGEFPELPEFPESDESFPEEEGTLPESELPELKFPGIGPEQAEKPDFTKYFGHVPKPAGKQGFPRYLEPEVPKLKESMDLPQAPGNMFGADAVPLFGRPIPEWQKPAGMPQMPAAGLPKSRQEARPYEKFEKSAVREELAVLRHKGTKGPIFVRVERFSDILAGAKTIKNNLKIADHTVAKLNEIDYDREKLFDKWHNVMADLQKKIIFMDKTLFKR